jgi:hypothetical protein
MVKLASAWTDNIHTSNITNGNTLTISRKESQTKVLTDLVKYVKPFNVRHEETSLKAAEWLNSSHLITKLNYTLVRNENWGIDQHRLVLNFSLADQYASNFILLKGLFAFADPKALSVAADRDAQTFEVEIKTNEAERVFSYLTTIFDLLNKEINFKEKLKQVIQWERHIKEQRKLVYNDSYTAAFA